VVLKSRIPRHRPVFVDAGLCDFDGLPCLHVESCDDVMALRIGLVSVFVCSRAVLKPRR
jgi:hypothetical protein